MLQYGSVSANSSLGINLIVQKILLYVCQTVLSLGVSWIQSAKEMETNYVFLQQTSNKDTIRNWLFAKFSVMCKNNTGSSCKLRAFFMFQ